MFSSYCYPSVSISILLFQGQDNYLLDSSPSIRFLLKLLKPIVVETGPDKAPSISQKLLVLRKDMLLSHDMTNRVDSNSTAIIQKVLETLVSCKDLKAPAKTTITMIIMALNYDDDEEREKIWKLTNQHE